MKCKCFIEGSQEIFSSRNIFYIWALFLKIRTFWGCNVFLVIDKLFFFFLQPLPEKVRNCLFPISLLINIEINSFNAIIQLINPNYACPIVNDPDHGVKMQQIFFLFFYHLSYIWMDFKLIWFGFDGQLGHLKWRNSFEKLY